MNSASSVFLNSAVSQFLQESWYFMVKYAICLNYKYSMFVLIAFSCYTTEVKHGTASHHYSIRVGHFMTAFSIIMCSPI